MFKSIRMAAVLTIGCLLLGVFVAPATYSQEEKDNSGTNPVKFTNDFRMWTELQGLPGDNSVMKTAFEYRTPVSKKLATRFRGYRMDVSLQGEESTSTFSGVGDMDARLMWLPHLTEKGAIAMAVEATFPTASHVMLGTGKTTLSPQIFAVLFNPLGPGTVFAPAYQYVVSVGGDEDRADISRSAIDLYVVWLAANKKHWAIFDPQIVFDHENEIDFSIIEAELGQMMFGPTSSYIRPGVGIGHDRPMDWNIEFGFKVIWK